MHCDDPDKVSGRAVTAARRRGEGEGIPLCGRLGGVGWGGGGIFDGVEFSDLRVSGNTLNSRIGASE